MLGIGLSLPQIAGAGSALNPLTLFAAGEQGVWYDPSDLTTLFQDSAGTTPVTAVEQPVGKILDKSGRGNHASQATTTSRPVLSAKVNELLNSRLNAGVSGAPGTAPTSWTYANSGTPTYTYSSDEETANGYKLRIETSAAQRAILRQFVAVAANTTYIASVVVDVTVGQVVYQLITWSSLPAGSTVTFQLNGVTVAGSAAIPVGRNTIAAIISVGATAGSPEFRIGVGVQSAGAADVTFRQPQVQTGTARTAYQWTNTASDYDTGFPLYLKFDGTDDSLATPSIDFSATDKMTVHAGVRKLSDAAQAMVVELSSSLGTNNGTFALQAPRTTSAGRFSFVAKGTGSGTVDADAAANASPVTAVLTSQMDIAGDATSLRVNGVSAGTSVADLGTGNLGNYPLYIGRRGGSTLPFNGRLYSLIVRGAASTAAQVVGAEKWVNGKTGAY